MTDKENMIIEGGSQNASRLAGHYAYPAPRYNAGGIEAISAIRGRPIAPAGNAPGVPSAVERLEARTRLEAQQKTPGSVQRERDNDVTSLNLYQDPAAARAGARNTPSAVVTGMNLDLLA